MKTDGVRSIVCLGDSITAGKSVPENRRWTSLLQSALDREAGDHWEVYTRGVPGESIVQGLERFEKDVEPLLPGCVLVEYGLNDCSHRPGRRIPRTGLAEFSAHLAELVRLVEDRGSRAILLTNHVVHPGKKEESSGRSIAENLAAYQAAIRRLSAEKGVRMIDVEVEFGEEFATGGGLAEDGVHLSRAGHRRYAEIICEGLRPILREVDSCAC